MRDGRGDKPGEFDKQTMLYIRRYPADLGLGPVPAGEPSWVSPDIAIIRADGTRGSEGAVGEADKVEVVVTNGGGIDARDAQVDAFLADPCTGFTPATAKLVGSCFVTVPNHNCQAVTFPWTPEPDDAGHRCMLARVGLMVPFDSYTDPTVFDVINDRHVAQRNVTVLKMETDSVSFAFLVVNPMRKEKESAFVLNARELPPEQHAERVRWALRSRFAQFGQVRLKEIGLTVGDHVAVTAGRRAANAPPLGLLRPAVPVPKAARVELRLREDEHRHAVVTIARNRDIRPGDLSVVQVEQIDARTERTVGGLWLVIEH
jgi:hypothetical protein